MHSHSPGLDRDDRALRQIVLITREDFERRWALLFGAQGHQTKYSTVRLPADDGDLPKVFVERDENLSVPVGVREDFRVARIARPIGSRFNRVSGGAKRRAGATPDAAIEQDLHGSTVGQRWFNPFVAHHASCIDETRADIIRFEPRVALQDRFRRVTGGEHPEHVFNCESMLPDDRLAGEDGRIRCDARKERVFTVVGHRWSPFTL